MKSNNKKTLLWVYARCKKYIPHILLIAFLSAIVSLGFIWLAMVSKNVLEIATGDKQGSFWHHGLILASLVLMQVILSGVDSIFKTAVAGKLTISIREYLFSVLNRKRYSNVVKLHSGDILNRFTSDTDVVVNGAVGIIPSVFSMFAKIIGGVAALILLDPKITIVVLVFGVCVPALGRLINKRYKYLHKECQQTEGVSRSFMQECFENVIVIKTFISEIPFIKKLDGYMKENYKFKIKRSFISATANLSLYSFFTIGYYAVLVWGAREISLGKITYGALIAFLQLISQLRAPLQNVSGIMPRYYSVLASAERLIEIEDFDDEISPLADEKLSKIKEGFSFIEGKNLEFAYDKEYVLKNFDFIINKGEVTAFTGESGSGKSTIFKLLLGLYEIENGKITINGKVKIDSSLRGLFAYVPQGNMVLSGSIRDNITMCNENISDEDIIKAAKIAEIHDCISSLENGYDTLLSERGTGLSGGQIQRISIARALLLDAPILLLDEATSELDEITESKVLRNIKQLKDKTVILVTHRNTSLDVCDNVIDITENM